MKAALIQKIILKMSKLEEPTEKDGNSDEQKLQIVEVKNGKGKAKEIYK